MNPAQTTATATALRAERAELAIRLADNKKQRTRVGREIRLERRAGYVARIAEIDELLRAQGR